jgi:hypothetical protein
MGGGLPEPITLVALIVAFGVAPFVALMITSYTKLVIVFGLLRTALGLQQTPPNMVLNGIAIILTIYIMAPVGMDVSDALRGRNFGAKGEGLSDIMAVVDAAKAPVKEFLLKHTQERDRKFFLKSAESIWPAELHAERADASLPDRLHHLPRLRGGRPHRGDRAARARHVDDRADDDLAAVQAAAVRDARRLDTPDPRSGAVVPVRPKKNPRCSDATGA